MKLVEKQLVKELFKKKIYLLLLLLLSAITAFMYFFVHFSVDPNLSRLEALTSLSESELAYKTGLLSNVSLAWDVLLAFLALTGFVFAFVLSRFNREHRKELGTFLALGYFRNDIMKIYCKVAGALSVAGGAVGILCGFFASDVLLDANRKTYQIEWIRKGLSGTTVAIGFLAPLAVLLVIAEVAWTAVGKKDAGVLMSGVKSAQYTKTLAFANRVSGIFPKKFRLPARLALRNILSACLILLSVMTVSVMFLLGFSLNRSSVKVKESQLLGHYYKYSRETGAELLHGEKENGKLRYLKAQAILKDGSKEVKWNLVGMDEDNTVYELLTEDGEQIAYPKEGEIVIGKQLEEVYGFHMGDTITVPVKKTSIDLHVSAVAYNAETGCAYMNKTRMCQALGLTEDTYNGILSMQEEKDPTGITRAEKLDALERDTVSNGVSAVIVQVMGCVIGCILLFLALMIHFQSVTGEMRILQTLGYRRKEIHRLLVDVYGPILAVGFVLTLFPAVCITKAVLRGLSRQIGDYMMYQMNLWIVLLIAGIVFVIYRLVQLFFSLEMRKVAV